MLARAVMTALLDKYLLQERTHVRTVSPAGQHLWAAVNVPSALWEHLLGRALQSARCVKTGMKTRT